MTREVHEMEMRDEHGENGLCFLKTVEISSSLYRNPIDHCKKDFGQHRYVLTWGCTVTDELNQWCSLLT